MPRRLSPDQKRAIADRLQYAREMGVYDLYRRPVAEVEDAAAEQQIANGIVEAGTREALPVVADKASALEILRAEIGGDCTRCRLGSLGRKQMVFGVGNIDAEIFFVGEGPGADEDEQGEPFVGRAGQLLNNMINAMGLRREDVYIANVVKCRPPGNRTPERDECEECSPFLLRQIDIVKPKVIVALGAVAAKNLLGVQDTMANLRGRWHDFRGTRLAVTYHPAYLLRDPRQKAAAWADLQMVMKHLGLAPKKA